MTKKHMVIVMVPVEVEIREESDAIVVAKIYSPDFEVVRKAVRDATRIPMASAIPRRDIKGGC